MHHRLIHWTFLLSALSIPSATSAETIEQPSAEETQPSATEVEQESPVHFHAEVGFRGEYMLNEDFAKTAAVSDDDYRARVRVRVRFGVDYTPVRAITTGFRISTGESNYPPSGWSSISDEFRRDAISLDRAFVNIRPHDAIEIRLGFQENPLFRPTQMIWDDDVQPGGLAEVFTLGDFKIVTSQFVLDEIRSVDKNASFLLANSIAYTFTDLGLEVGVFNYHYTNPDTVARDIDSGALAAVFRSNRFSPDGSATYFSGYSIVGAGLGFNRNKIHASMDIAYNLGAKSDASLGETYDKKEALSMGGLVGYGDLNDLWDWSVFTGAFYIPADATIAAFNNDDYQQTNVFSIPFIANLELVGGFRLVWDTYFQRKLDVNYAAHGGLVHDKNALKIRSRMTLEGHF